MNFDIIRLLFLTDQTNITFNKFPKEFEYIELGKIKSEITDIIKNSK